MKAIIFAKPVKNWSDGLYQWKWYLHYAFLNMEGRRIDISVIYGDTEEEVLKKAKEIEAAYNKE